AGRKELEYHRAVGMTAGGKRSFDRVVTHQDVRRKSAPLIAVAVATALRRERTEYPRQLRKRCIGHVAEIGARLLPPNDVGYRAEVLPQVPRDSRHERQLGSGGHFIDVLRKIDIERWRRAQIVELDVESRCAVTH